MIVEMGDWAFGVDVDATLAHTKENSTDHCLCPYCKNYYETLNMAHPGLERLLAEFGVDPMGPSELMPFEPTLLLACYRVRGKIIRWGQSPFLVGTVPVLAEFADEESFFLWVGELEVPWVQPEAMEDVVSPANLPEFLERMEAVWTLRHGRSLYFS